MMHIRKAIVLMLPLGCLVFAGAAFAGHTGHKLTMATVELGLEEFPGNDLVLSGDYEEAILVSMKEVDTAWNIGKVAARTNLCISYTALKDYENAIKWCDAAVAVNRIGWVTKNNRAVLHFLMQEHQQGMTLLKQAHANAHRGVNIARAIHENETSMYVAAMEELDLNNFGELALAAKPSD